MSSEGFEFDVTVTVRKRVHVAGPTDREAARDILKKSIQGLGFGPFIKYTGDRFNRWPIETVISNDFDVADVVES